MTSYTFSALERTFIKRESPNFHPLSEMMAPVIVTRLVLKEYQLWTSDYRLRDKGLGGNPKTLVRSPKSIIQTPKSVIL